MTKLVGNDVSHFQGVIDFSVYKNNSNFILMKATEGLGYIDPLFLKNQDEARKASLLRGFYHFARPDLDNDPKVTANFFCHTVSPLQEGELLILDYEAEWDGDVVSWCKKWLDEVKRLTGVKPLIYLNQSLLKRYDWSSVSSADYGLWVAAYTLDPNKNEFESGSWAMAAMQQWTNMQKVPGVSGNVDGDVFFGDAKAYSRYGYRSIDMPSETPSPTPIPETPPEDEKPPNTVPTETVPVEDNGEVYTKMERIKIALKKIISDISELIDIIFL